MKPLLLVLLGFLLGHVTATVVELSSAPLEARVHGPATRSDVPREHEPPAGLLDFGASSEVVERFRGWAGSDLDIAEEAGEFLSEPAHPSFVGGSSAWQSALDQGDAGSNPAPLHQPPTHLRLK